MGGNPPIGVPLRWMGGLASASFYAPYRGVKRWSRGLFWITGGIFSWVIAPWVFAAIQTHNLRMPSIILFGTLWGFAFHEWKDAAPRTRAMVWSGVGLPAFATIIIGYGNRLAA